MDTISIFAHPEDSAFAALPKAAARLSLSIVRSWRYMSDELAEKLLSMVNADTLWALCLIFAAWVIATVVGGPIAVVIDGFLILYGLYSIYEQLSGTWDSLKAWATAAYQATNDRALEEAAKLFAKAAAEGSIDILAAVLTHKLFLKTQGTLGKRFPTPKWLKDEVLNAEAERRTRASSGKSAEPSEGPADDREVLAKADEKNGKTAEPEGQLKGRIEDPTSRALNLARGAGASNLARGGSALTGALVGGAVLLGIGAVAAVASVGGRNAKKKSK